MSSISPGQIKQILEVVDAALVMHTEWHSDLIRTLLCRTKLDDSYIAKDAHHKCDFGCWFYTRNAPSFHDLPIASKIGDLHKKMHDSARDICLEMSASGMLKTDSYDYFIRNLTRFKEELTAFRKRTTDTLGAVT